MHRILFYIGPWPVYSYGAMISLGIIAGTALAWYLARRDGGKYTDNVLDLVLYVVIAGIIGARALYVIFEWNFYGSNLKEIFALWHGGLSVQGAVFGGLLMVIYYSRKHKLPFWEFADYLAPGLLMGQAIGRMGCFLNGCCYGIPTDTFLGVVYPPGTDAYNAFGATPLLPSQLFEVAYTFIVLGLLLWVGRSKPFKGFFVLGYFLFYSLGRFLIEFTRANNLFTVYGLTIAQVACVFTFTVALVLMIILYRNAYDRTKEAPIRH